MASSSALLLGALALLLIDGVIELAFITSMVRWLHVRSGQGPFLINDDGNVFPIRVKPQNLLVDQGHASNGAAGTAFIVIGLGGFLALFLRRRQLKRNGSLHGFVRYFYAFWLGMTVISAIYSLACFVYVMVETYTHNDQSIDLAEAAKIGAQGFPAEPPYPLLEWVPQTWFAALLNTPLAKPSERSSIAFHLRIQQGWEWNLIPMTILGFVVATLAFRDRKAQKLVQRRDESGERFREISKGDISPTSA